MSEETMQVTNGEEELVRQVAAPLVGARTWMNVYGYLMLITGVLSFWTLIGLLNAWLGYLVIRAAQLAGEAYATGRRATLLEAQNNLKTFFTVNGVLIVIGLVVALVTICLSLLFPVLFAGLTGWDY